MFDDVDLYAHSNPPVTDTSATAYEDILAAATRADDVNSNLRIKSPFKFKFYIKYVVIFLKVMLLIFIFIG
jgi:hypothetical protein